MERHGYKQFTARDRLLLAQLKHKGLNQAEIARRIGKDPSSVSRELKRNSIVITPEDRFFNLRIEEQLVSKEQLEEFLLTQPAESRETVVGYSHTEAEVMANNRALAAQCARRGKMPETRAWVVEKLHAGWSPEQIAGRSKRDAPESVSHEFVYTLVHQSRKSGGDLHRLLKRFRRRKQRSGAREYPKTPRPNHRVSIDKRPAIVEARSRIGDCEADLIIGYKQSGCILSVIDRKSRAVSLRKVESKHMSVVSAALGVALKTLGVALTLTVDNGKEFYALTELTKRFGVRVFFCHPYCSTERGSIENLNGLVRYYLPKRASFAGLTQERLDEIAELLNRRPRKCLGFLTPAEVQTKHVRLCTRSRVALES